MYGGLVDCRADIGQHELEQKLLQETRVHGSLTVKSIMRRFLPQRLAAFLIHSCAIDSGKRVHQVSTRERKALVGAIKSFSLTIRGTLAIEKAMVTNGGVLTKEINPKTMESRITPGLYFAGEMIDGCCVSGGFNLQQAFSTGFLAGQSTACAQ